MPDGGGHLYHSLFNNYYYFVKVLLHLRVASGNFLLIFYFFKVFWETLLCCTDIFLLKNKHFSQEMRRRKEVERWLSQMKTVIGKPVI